MLGLHLFVADETGIDESGVEGVVPPEAFVADLGGVVRPAYGFLSATADADDPVGGDALPLAQSGVDHRLEEFHTNVFLGEVVDGWARGFKDTEAVGSFGEWSAGEKNLEAYGDRLDDGRTWVVPHGFLAGAWDDDISGSLAFEVAPVLLFGGVGVLGHDSRISRARYDVVMLSV
jgi:hypothetical protein